jgi:hypothetical protein
MVWYHCHDGGERRREQKIECKNAGSEWVHIFVLYMSAVLLPCSAVVLPRSAAQVIEVRP